MTRAAPAPAGVMTLDHRTHPDLRLEWFDDDWSVQGLSDALADGFASHVPMSVTWLNHFSAQGAVDRAQTELLQFDVVGVDGKLLQFILGGRSRTSADLVVPGLLSRLRGARVAVVGGSPETMAARRDAVARLLSPDSEVALTLDGYGGLPALQEFQAQLRRARVDVALIGLGSGLQEQYAAAAKAAFVNGGLSLTCGGLMDQLLVDGYYPAWAYPLRLNWLVRLAREPRRLWRRYTVNAVEALSHRAQLRQTIQSLPGLWV